MSTEATVNHRVTHRICPLCEACCGLEIRTQGDQVVSIRGHEADVFSHGYICPKAIALKDLHEDPDRLRTPLIKRDGRFVEASWDEAFAEIERRLLPIQQAHGKDAVALSLGNPAVHKAGLILYLPRLLKALGTKNFVSASTLDQMPKQLASGLMFGHWLSVAVPDIERSDFLLLLGANPMASNGSMWTVPDFRGKAKALRERGGRLVVIDPRRTETAAVADAHHFIRPGSDVHLLLAMLHTLFDEGLVRLGRLAAHVNGVDELREAIAPFTPERAAEKCGIDAATIRGLARELAAAKRGCIYGRIGTTVQAFGTTCSWLIDVLNVLTGHLDEQGGAMFPKAAAFSANTAGESGKGRGIRSARWHSRVSHAPEVFGEIPITCLAEEIETAGDGQVRALITIASNPVLSAPNGARLSAALDRLDFMLSLDIYLNETSRHADVILPGASPLEDSHYDVAFPQLSHRNHARHSAAVFAPAAGSMPEWQLLLKLTAIASGRGAATDVLAYDDELLAAELGKAMGDNATTMLQTLRPRTGPDRQVDLALRTGPYGDRLTLDAVQAAPGGIDLGALQPRMPEVLRTPSGRIELAPPMVMADLSRALEDRDAGDDATLRIIGRRHVRSNNSWMHNLPTLAKGPERCTVLVNPADAARLALADGGTANIQGASGQRISATVAVSDEMMQGVVSLPHGWGHGLDGVQLSVAVERPGANLNALMNEALRDPLSGNAVLNGAPVSLAPA